ncbi:bifunctional DNA-formamidopyrimidine glycosylase/DNA-(apurinic or apyrimidinic site) lyase [Varibaculum vaginae]|uniref:bifunctional DNA-formamidopyrimidine glycosylase/DNA-(apurinic or apyrimidinic site) lyase n=1 Tax=Varibaculum vaginae TaxID=2364797 RepID=UPI000F08A0A4|nr:bifunctional DNA-formamidopyrimidine glycosylase/DNA-(apurinic or apyrimidinic site) lyase [Varibaculum vaginae]
MPELPEVEVVCRGLEEQIIGAQIEKVEVFFPGSLRGQDAKRFSEALKGWKITNAVRRGKFLWLLGEDQEGKQTLYSLVIHLGMSGQLLINKPKIELSHRNQGHLRVCITLRDGRTVNFVDQRTFGRMVVEPLVETKDNKPAGIGAESHLIPRNVELNVARDVLDPYADFKKIAEKVHQRKSSIKHSLLDQKLVSGIGNIYADESLFAARISPAQSAKTLTEERIVEIFKISGKIMEAAIEHGGTSFDELYVDTSGNPGYFEQELKVYGRGGKPCKVCGTTLEKLQQSGRNATYCPQCQVLEK